MSTRRIIYVLLIAICSCVVSCREVTIGYMKTEHAKYSIDTLYVGEGRILEQIEAIEQQNPPELIELAYTYEEIKALAEEADAVYNEYSVLDEELASLDEEADAERIDEIYARMDELVEWLDYLDGLYFTSYDLEDVLLDAGYWYDEIEMLCDKYRGLRKTIEEAIPWSTATIEGVLGTQPIQYSIANVSSTDGDADLFMSELDIYGGGRMQLPFACKAPKGTYRVSILIENEGYSNLLDNAFTFIVE